MKKVLLCVLLCGCSILLQCDSVLSVSCQPGSELEASCVESRNGSCALDHSPELEGLQCLEMYEHPSSPPSPPSINITQCEPSGTDNFKHCPAFTSHTIQEAQYFLVERDLTPVVTSLDPEHFAVNLRWNHSVRAGALNLPEGKRLVGYEVRLKRGENDVLQCWCIWETNVSNIMLGLDHSLSYLPSLYLNFEFRSLPFSTLGDRYYDRTASVDWPSTCNARGVSRSTDTCPPPLYSNPRSVEVESELSNGVKELRVSWLHPAMSPASLYYVYITSELHNFSMLANGTRQVTISDLSPDVLYTVQVQAYAACTGLSALISEAGQAIGCGALSEAIMESPLVSTTGTIEATGTTVATTNIPPTSPDVLATASTKHGHVLVPLLSTLFVAIFLLITGVLIFLVVYYKCRKHDEKLIRPEDVPEAPYPHIRVLVLYSTSSPQDEQILIQYTVVGRLRCEFTVTSLNDHTEKSLMDWLESQIRQSHCTLIVCNKTFHSEWVSPHGSRFVNALKTIVEFSVSDGSIDRFATVLLEKDHKRFVPDYLYLRHMKRFIVEEDATDDEVEKLLDFVKNSYKSRQTGHRLFARNKAGEKTSGQQSNSPILGDSASPTPSPKHNTLFASYL